MAKRTLSGYLGVVILPDLHLAHAAALLTESDGVREAEYRVKPDSVHIALYQAANFKDLPLDDATRAVAKLNEYLVSNPAGELLLYFLDVRPWIENESFLCWEVDRSKENRCLMTAHGMSLALSAYVNPRVENKRQLEHRLAEMPAPKRLRERKLHASASLFGHMGVGEDYSPHIVIAANMKGFKGFTPAQEPLIGSAARVVLARMGKCGRIEEILI